MMIEEWAAAHGEYPCCQACGEPIYGDVCVFGSDGFRCDGCCYLLWEEADAWAYEHCRVLDAEACAKEGLSDDERLCQTNFHELAARFDDGSVRGMAYRAVIEVRLLRLIEAFLDEVVMVEAGSPWLFLGF